MAQIGSFTRDDNGAFAGTIRTLALNAKTTIKPVAKETSAPPTTASPPTASSSAQAGARPPGRPARNTSRSSSTTRPSRSGLRNVVQGETSSTSSSGRDDRPRRLVLS